MKIGLIKLIIMMIRYIGLIEVLHIDKAWHDNGLPKVNYLTLPDISMPIFFFNNAKDFAIFYLNC